jgi:hypothetical protein
VVNYGLSQRAEKYFQKLGKSSAEISEEGDGTGGPIDGQLRLVSLQTDNFCLFLHQPGQTTNFRLQDQQMVNRLRKIICASIFLLIF